MRLFMEITCVTQYGQKDLNISSKPTPKTPNTVFPHIRPVGNITYFLTVFYSKITVHKWVGIIRIWVLFDGRTFFQEIMASGDNGNNFQSWEKRFSALKYSLRNDFTPLYGFVAPNGNCQKGILLPFFIEAIFFQVVVC